MRFYKLELKSRLHIFLRYLPETCLLPLYTAPVDLEKVQLKLTSCIYEVHLKYLHLVTLVNVVLCDVQLKLTFKSLQSSFLWESPQIFIELVFYEVHLKYQSVFTSDSPIGDP